MFKNYLFYLLLLIINLDIVICADEDGNLSSSYLIGYNYLNTNTFINETLAKNNMPELKSKMGSVGLSYFFTPIDLKNMHLEEIKDSSLSIKIMIWGWKHMVIGFSYSTAPHDEYDNRNFSSYYDFNEVSFYFGFRFKIYKSLFMRIGDVLHYTNQDLIISKDNLAGLDDFIGNKEESWKFNVDHLGLDLMIGLDYAIVKNKNAELALGFWIETLMNDGEFSSVNGTSIIDLPSSYLSGYIFKLNLQVAFSNSDYN